MAQTSVEALEARCVPANSFSPDFALPSVAEVRVVDHIDLDALPPGLARKVEPAVERALERLGGDHDGNDSSAHGKSHKNEDKHADRHEISNKGKKDDLKIPGGLIHVPPGQAKKDTKADKDKDDPAPGPIRVVPILQTPPLTNDDAVLDEAAPSKVLLSTPPTQGEDKAEAQQSADAAPLPEQIELFELRLNGEKSALTLPPERNETEGEAALEEATKSASALPESLTAAPTQMQRLRLAELALLERPDVMLEDVALNSSGLDLAIQQFLNDLDAVGADVRQALSGREPWVWLLALGAAAGAAAAWKRRQGAAQATLAAAASWAPGLPQVSSD